MATSSPRTVTTLNNGLQLVIEEQHRAPVVSTWVWYRVGSRNEVSGITGASHWVEHMAFKPSKAFPDNSRDRLLAREGSVSNAFTWIDYTAYYATVPSGRQELVFEIEADRMASAEFNEEVVETERTVIISERGGSENYPTSVLNEEVQAAAYRAHTYGHETIGHLCDLKTMTRDDLYGHYKRYYVPQNATLVVVGDCDTDDTIRSLTNWFGEIPAGESLPEFHTKEPALAGERRLVVNGEGGTAYLQMAYPSPEAGHEDFFPFLAACTVLGGASSFMLGSRPNSRSSRLWQALVDGGLAADVAVSTEPTIDPFLCNIVSTVRPDRNPDEIESAIDRELARMRDEVVGHEELARVKKQSRAAFILGGERITNRALSLGVAATVASLSWLDRYESSLEAVTAEDIREVCRKWFPSDRRIVGHYLPPVVKGDRGEIQ